MFLTKVLDEKEQTWVLGEKLQCDTNKEQELQTNLLTCLGQSIKTATPYLISAESVGYFTNVITCMAKYTCTQKGPQSHNSVPFSSNFPKLTPAHFN